MKYLHLKGNTPIYLLLIISLIPFLREILLLVFLVFLIFNFKKYLNLKKDKDNSFW